MARWFPLFCASFVLTFVFVCLQTGSFADDAVAETTTLWNFSGSASGTSNNPVPLIGIDKTSKDDEFDMVTFSGTAVPEPASFVLLGIALCGLAANRILRD